VHREPVSARPSQPVVVKNSIPSFPLASWRIFCDPKKCSTWNNSLGFVAAHLLPSKACPERSRRGPEFASAHQTAAGSFSNDLIPDLRCRKVEVSQIGTKKNVPRGTIFWKRLHHPGPSGPLPAALDDPTPGLGCMISRPAVVRLHKKMLHVEHFFRFWPVARHFPEILSRGRFASFLSK
jgi:hypothetical protein